MVFYDSRQINFPYPLPQDPVPNKAKETAGEKSFKAPTFYK
jgi:hypothetical protein